MAQQIINVGASPNDGTGDTLRDSQVKANQNFTELYSAIIPFNPSDYDLVDFTNLDTDRFARLSDIPTSVSGKRSVIFHWQINQSIAASTSWYRQDSQVGVRGNFTTNASLTPTNAFANNIVVTPAFTLPFQAKIKSVTVYGWTNQGATNVRFCVNSSKLSTSSGVSTPVDCLILADFSVNTQNIQVNGFRHEQTTGLNTAALPALQEIRLFFNNNNVSSNIFDGLIIVEFEEVL